MGLWNGSKEIIYGKISSYNKEVDDLLKDANQQLYDDWYSNLVGKFPEGYYEQLTEEDKGEYKSLNNIYNDINQSYAVQCLYHDIKRDIGDFADQINFRTLLHPFFVEPSFNNERLRAQSGFFLFEPYDGVSCSVDCIHDDIDSKVSLLDKNSEQIRLIISGKEKKQILEELDILCEINQATLFPDQENVASYVMNTFIKQKGC